jgi:hypothetical protein
VVVAVPFAVKVDAAGETLHVTYVGRLLQLRLSVSAKPFSLVNVTVVVWLLCVGTVRLGLASATLKSCGVAWMVSVTAAEVLPL